AQLGIEPGYERFVVFRQALARQIHGHGIRKGCRFWGDSRTTFRPDDAFEIRPSIFSACLVSRVRSDLVLPPVDISPDDVSGVSLAGAGLVIGWHRIASTTCFFWASSSRILPRPARRPRS